MADAISNVQNIQLQIQMQNQHIKSIVTAAQRDAIDKLVGVPNEQITAEMLPQRRLFFENLVLINEKHGENLAGPPQVAKTTVDLYKLYSGVRQRNGFKVVRSF